MNKINMILACDQLGGIGLNNGLPWDNKEDLKLFKHITDGKVVIMGENTFNSLKLNGGLPNRTNIVISKNKKPNTVHAEVYWCNLINDAFSIAINKGHNREIYIIGGKSIYEQTLKYVTGKIYISHMNFNTNCDTYLDVSFFDEIENLYFSVIHYHQFSDFTLKIYKQLKDV